MAEDSEVFHRDDLPNQAFPVMEEIRRQGKMCDVTLEVRSIYLVKLSQKELQLFTKQQNFWLV